MALSQNLRTITNLTVQKRNSDRVSVFLDGEFAFGLSFANAAELHVGQRLSDQRAEELQHLESIDKAVSAAYRLVSRRPRSVFEIERNLSEKGYEDAIIAPVVNKLKAMDLLDDEGFGRYWIEQRETFKPRSQFALRQELRLKGLSPDIIEKLLAEIDDEDLARRAARKQLHRWQSLPKEKFHQRMAGFLQRRGFDFGTVRQITEEMWRSCVEIANNDQATQKET